MNIQKANRVIEEFMGWRNNSLGYFEEIDGRTVFLSTLKPSESLDLSLKAWVKIGGFRSLTSNNGFMVVEFWLGSPAEIIESSNEGRSIQEAVAMATAKVILRLKQASKTEEE